MIGSSVLRYPHNRMNGMEWMEFKWNGMEWTE